MLRDGRSNKAFDSLFVPVGTVELSAAFQRRVTELISNRPCRNENRVKPNVRFFSA